MIPDFSGENGKKLKAKAEEAARLAIEAQISQKAGFTKGFQKQQPTPTGVGVKDRERKAKGFYGEVVDLVTGDAATAEKASTALASIVNKNLPEGDSRVTNITRSENGMTFMIERQDGGSFEISAVTSDGDVKSTNQIVDELFEEVNPYGDVDLILARDSFDGTIGDAIGEGAAAGTVRQESVNFEYQAPILISGNEVGPYDFLVSKVDTAFDEGYNASQSEIQGAFQTVLDELVLGSPLEDSGYSLEASSSTGNQKLTYMDESTNPPTKKTTKIDGGFIRLYFPGLPDTGYGNGVRVIEGLNDMTTLEAYTELQEHMDEWADQTNASGGSMSGFN